MNILYFIRTRYGIPTVIYIGIFLLLPLCSFSQTFFGESGNPADNGTLTAATVAVAPPAAMQAGDLVIIFAQYRSNGATLNISATGGQTWTAETAFSGSTHTTRIFWCEFDGTWGANPSVTGGNGSNPLTVVMYVYRPANPAYSWGVNVGPVHENVNDNVQTITGVTTTASNTVTMGFWASTDNNTWGTLNGTGWSKAGLPNQYRNLGGSDQSHTAAYNIQAAPATIDDVTQTQSASDPTHKTIISWYEVPPPSNDDCANAITLNSAATCVSTTGWLNSATYTTLTGACGSSAGDRNDVWYSFVANSTSPSIYLSSAPAESSIQLFSGTCGALTSLQCEINNTTLVTNGLTIGATYYVRIWSDNNTAGTFNICVVNPPSNDECSNAVNLAVNFACSNIPGTMVYSTPSTIPLGGSCPGILVADVWYKFTAVNNTARVTLGSIGAGFSNPRIEVLTGNCGSFTSVACGASPLDMIGTLTAGTTYYIRIYSSSGALPVSNAGFNICVTSSILPSVRHGNSYVNISKKTTGGVVEPGDTLEIRMTVQHSQAATTMSNLRFVDNIPTNTTMLAGINDSIRIITNEGLTYKKYTPTADADAATYLAAPPAGQFNIRMNLSFGTSNPGTPPDNTSTNIATTTGTMVSTNYPRGGGGLLFAAAYRVVATGGVGDTITLNPAQFIYNTGGSDVTLTANSYKILISDPLDLCANSIGINNAAELGGTFGTGTTLNRPTDLTNPIPGYSFLNNVSASNGLGDGRYAIVKNISPRSGTNRNANRVPNCGAPPANDPINCNNRMHGGHWDIDGDHTGTNDAIGNIPPDDTTIGGYMLMVNADYVASEVFSQTLNNLCPNTYYEFSAWFRNICPTCGSDSTNAQFAGTPTSPANGYVGVYPNLSFALDGLDYYSTGEIDLGGWQKKGFVFRTGATQTNATFSIRNNSQGGGGNDWVMDDIAVATCLPTMSYSPTINPNVCEANSIVIADTVSSFFNNYTTYKWQRSINGGANWSDITGVTALPDTNYYITTYTVPPSNTTMGDSGTLYRVVVATTADNLSDPNCNISDGVTITLHVLDCEPVLDIDFLYFNGLVLDARAKLSWSTSHEDAPVTYIIERSVDGRDYSESGKIEGYYNGANSNYYSFSDGVAINDKAWYRIVILNANGKKKYSSAIQLYNKTPDFQLSNLINPFRSSLSFNITVAASSAITSELVDFSGRTVLTGRQLVYAGTNSITLNNTHILPAGIYTLRVSTKDKFITRRVVKTN